VIQFYILLGPPGAGKGTQAEAISEMCGIPHISSGNIFRENLSEKTELGLKAKQFMDCGELVPDDITIGMIKDRLAQADCNNGAVLDGFPRTPFQAEALSAILSEHEIKITSVINIEVPAGELIERLSGRRVCRAEGHVYHMKYNPPKEEGICDIDQSTLYQRDDDLKDTVVQRIKVYESQTAPLIEYYQNKGLLVEIDGSKPIHEVTELILDAIQCGGRK
jgi:adenylate kinase